MKKTLMIVPVVAAFLTGCAGMSDTQQRTLSGGAIGAAAGAGITAIAGGDAIWGETLTRKAAVAPKAQSFAQKRGARVC